MTEAKVNDALVALFAGGDDAWSPDSFGTVIEPSVLGDDYGNSLAVLEQVEQGAIDLGMNPTWSISGWIEDSEGFSSVQVSMPVCLVKRRSTGAVYLSARIQRYYRVESVSNKMLWSSKPELLYQPTITWRASSGSEEIGLLSTYCAGEWLPMINTQMIKFSDTGNLEYLKAALNITMLSGKQRTVVYTTVNEDPYFKPPVWEEDDID